MSWTFPDLASLQSPAVRRRDPPLRVWVDLAVAINGGRSGVPPTRPNGGVITGYSVPGLLIAWVKSDWGDWLAIVETLVKVENGESAVTRLLVARAAVKKDSIALRRKLDGKTSNRPTLRQRSADKPFN